MEKFKLIVAGGRDFDDYAFLKDKLDKLLVNKVDVEIVQGECTGADELGKRYAIERGYTCKPFVADWYPSAKKGKLDLSAGPRRNREMAAYADAAVIFDTGGPGSASMFREARKVGLDVRFFTCHHEPFQNRHKA